jgi:hypothetical protein
MARNRLMGLIVSILLLSTINTNAQELTITFTTTQISGAHYAPNHVFAVWIKDANNNYVRTLMVYAQQRKSYLFKWKSNSGGNLTDAITGATTSSFKSYSISWNLKNYQNNTVPAGSYKLCMEMTSDHIQGPYREIDFTTGGNSYSLTPTDEKNFKNVSLAYMQGTTGIETTFNPEKYVKIFPNPSVGNLFADLYLEQNSETTFSFYSLNNQLVARKKITLSEGQNRVDLCHEAHNLPTGEYLLLVETNHYTIGNRFVIK